MSDYNEDESSGARTDSSANSDDRVIKVRGSRNADKSEDSEEEPNFDAEDESSSVPESEDSDFELGRKSKSKSAKSTVSKSTKPNRKRLKSSDENRSEKRIYIIFAPSYGPKNFLCPVLIQEPSQLEKAGTPRNPTRNLETAIAAPQRV